MIHHLAKERGPKISKGLYIKDLAHGRDFSKSLPVCSLGCWRGSDVTERCPGAERSTLTMERQRSWCAQVPEGLAWWEMARAARGEVGYGDRARAGRQERGWERRAGCSVRGLGQETFALQFSIQLQAPPLLLITQFMHLCSLPRPHRDLSLWLRIVTGKLDTSMGKARTLERTELDTKLGMVKEGAGTSRATFPSC